MNKKWIKTSTSEKPRLTFRCRMSSMISAMIWTPSFFSLHVFHNLKKIELLNKLSIINKISNSLRYRPTDLRKRVKSSMRKPARTANKVSKWVKFWKLITLRSHQLRTMLMMIKQAFWNHRLKKGISRFRISRWLKIKGLSINIRCMQTISSHSSTPQSQSAKHSRTSPSKISEINNKPRPTWSHSQQNQRTKK